MPVLVTRILLILAICLLGASPTFADDDALEAQMKAMQKARAMAYESKNFDFLVQQYRQNYRLVQQIGQRGVTLNRQQTVNELRKFLNQKPMEKIDADFTIVNTKKPRPNQALVTLNQRIDVWRNGKQRTIYSSRMRQLWTKVRGKWMLEKTRQWDIKVTED